MKPLVLKYLLFILFITFSCNKKENVENNTNATNHIKYFGFTLIDTYWDDPTDNDTKTNYIDEVAAFSNIADILVVNPEDNIVNRLNVINSYDVKSIVYISELFFENVGTNSPSGNGYALRADYQNRWNTFVTTNNLQTNKDLIQSLYIGEEPTWNGITFLELKTATDYIKQSIADVPIMIIEAYPAVEQLQVPETVDWIGFDHYFIKDPKNDTTFLSELNTLKSKLTTNNQKLVMVMDTHFIDFAHGDFGNITLNEMEQVANSYYELAKSETKTIAILGYFWPSGFDAPEAIGARNMPNAIKQNYINIGKEITNK